MARELFTNDWENWAPEKLLQGRADLCGLVESVRCMEKEKSLREQLLLVKPLIIKNQDAILGLVKIAATNPAGEGVGAGLAKTLEELREVDKTLRERLMVLQMAKECGWPAAEKLQARFDGVYENEHVAKVREEEEKRKRKEKQSKEKDRERDKERSKYGPMRMRQNFGYSRPPLYRQPMGYSQGPQFQAYRQNDQTSYGQPRYGSGQDGCFRCGKIGHRVGQCREKPKFGN